VIVKRGVWAWPEPNLLRTLALDAKGAHVAQGMIFAMSPDGMTVRENSANCRWMRMGHFFQPGKMLR
jgi:hypothetical protein